MIVCLFCITSSAKKKVVFVMCKKVDSMAFVQEQWPLM